MEKRREARQRHRRTKWIGKSNKNKRSTTAMAEKPHRKIKFGKIFKIATMNVEGCMKMGKREEIEQYMKRNEIKIMALQETRVRNNTREARKEYTWFFSGERQHKTSTYTPGVGFVIKNDFVKYIEDIIPHTDRIIELKLKGAIQINLICVYMPQAERTEEEKDEVYKTLSEITKKCINKGPCYILGDWNARMQKHQHQTERQVFGKWTFEPEKAQVHKLTEHVTSNRKNV